jgi:hypothetical protein
MPLLVELPPEIEARVQEAAEAEGIDTAAYVRDAMAASHPFPAAPASMTEKELVEEINRGFSEAFWERFRVLVRRREAGTMTVAEQQEAISMSDRTEARAVERLQCLLELSERRGKSVDELMTEMSIRPVSLD